MNRKLWLQTAVTLTLAIPAAAASAQSPGKPQARLTGVSGPGAASSPAKAAVVFSPVALGAAAQQLTATVTLDPAFGSQIPTASLHYGLDYTLGSVACASQTCSVSVSFNPTLPGARPDAIFLSIAGERIASIPVSGTGSAPLALFNPAAGTASGGTGALAVADENGTLYLFNPAQHTITSTDSSGKSTQLPLTGLGTPRAMVIDGAGVLYLLDDSAGSSLLTFDTVQGVASTRALPAPASSIDSITLDAAGSLYAISSGAHMLYTLAPDGTSASSAFTLSSGVPTSAIALSNGAGFALGGNTLQQLSAIGVASQVSVDPSVLTGSSLHVLATDAAGTLFADSDAALLALASPSFSASAGSLPAALALGSDGSLYTAAGQATARINRAQDQLDFGVVAPGTSADPQSAVVYNGGNQPLTISDIRVSGSGFGIASSSGATCVGGSVIASGASCRISVGFVAPSSSASTGSVTITSNSLNQPSASSVVSLVAHAANGSQAVYTPTSLSFPSTTVQVASAPMTVTLSNPGTAALNFSSIALAGAGSGSYSLSQNCFAGATTSLSPGGSCTLTVIFKPLTAATQTASVSVVDDLAGTPGSTQTIALSGVGSAAPAPVITFAASSANGASTTTLSFGSSTSAALEVFAGTGTPPTGTVTISNTGNAVMNISSIALALSGTSTVLPYTQTNTCGATLAAGANCVVTIQFIPPLNTGTTYTASLVVTDNAVGSPQAFAISGIAIADDYTVTASAGSLTISSQGGSGSVAITATPDPGPFANPIDFTVFGMPRGATYSFSPSSINAATAPATTTLSITLPKYYNPILSELSGPARPGRALGPAAACLLIGVCFGFRRRRMPRLTRALQLIAIGLLGFAATSLTGCGGVPTSSGVAPGTYYLTITGQSANGVPTSTSTTTGFYPAGIATHTVSVTLIVQ